MHCADVSTSLCTRGESNSLPWELRLTIHKKTSLPRGKPFQGWEGMARDAGLQLQGEWELLDICSWTCKTPDPEQWELLDVGHAGLQEGWELLDVGSWTFRAPGGLGAG